jgi:hypothetical protein
MVRKLVALVLCLIIPGAVFAGNTGAAMGNFNGDVSVNGRAVPPTTAVFPGDKVVTGRNAAARISRPGFALSLGSDSSAELLGEGARMLNGSVYVTLKRGAVVEYADLHISAASEIATVEIVSRKGSERIAARSGDLNVSDTASSMTVPQGQALYAKAMPAASHDRADRNYSSNPAPAVTNHITVLGLHGYWLGAIAGGIIVGGTVGALAATGTYPFNSKTSTALSPSKP